ncbi:MAG: hypothetical protein AB1695_12540 [Stygiobacter sp.]
MKNTEKNMATITYDNTNTYRPPSKRCELCKHYGMIDSGYGNCKRYPPVLTYVRLLRIEYRYPEVAWCENACGEFNSK